MALGRSSLNVYRIEDKATESGAMVTLAAVTNEPINVKSSHSIDVALLTDGVSLASLDSGTFSFHLLQVAPKSTSLQKEQGGSHK